MSRSLSTLLAAWLIAAACAGSIALLQRTVPGIDAVGRIDPSRPSSVRPVPMPFSLELMRGRPEAGNEPVLIVP